jgi:hypothetical protein
MVRRRRGLLDIDSSAAKKYGDSEKSETDENRSPELLASHCANSLLGRISGKMRAKT